jgi:gliding motility-associated-like protein
VVCFGGQYTSPQGNSYGAGSFIETLVSFSGCDSVVTYVITELPLISSTINGDICYGDEFISPDGNVYGGGSYVETLTASSGCDSIVTINVFESSPVTASFFVNQQDLTTLNTEVAFVNTSSGAESFIWTFGDGLAGSFDESPTYAYPEFEATSYSVMLIATNLAGCTDTLIEPIVFEEELIYYVPNTFTPDGDALNNVFEPVFTSGYDPFDYSLLIFNRWGEVIFESQDARLGWDGTYNGKYVQDGTYSWKLEFKLKASDERRVDTGHVIMIR